MSTCLDISLPTPQIPSLPNINPALTITFPPIALPTIPCCKITITGLSIPIPIAEVLAPLLTDIKVINAAITAANVAIAAWIASLPALEIPNCPFNGATI